MATDNELLHAILGPVLHGVALGALLGVGVGWLALMLIRRNANGNGVKSPNWKIPKWMINSVVVLGLVILILLIQSGIFRLRSSPLSETLPLLLAAAAVLVFEITFIGFISISVLIFNYRRISARAQTLG
jgi:hypothetical protein